MKGAETTMPEFEELQHWLLCASSYPNPIKVHKAVCELARYVLALEKRVEELEAGKQDTGDE